MTAHAELHFPEHLIPALQTRYSESHRRYHALSHVHALMALLAQYRHLAQAPALIEAAIWYHDAIYSPHRSDNEARSAQLAHQDLSAAGWPETAAERVADLVRATALHDATEGDTDAWLFLDLDLAILASPPDLYATYQQAVREEFHWVPLTLYRQGRRKALAHIAERPFIYRTPALRAQWEAAARRNLSGELATLGS